MKKIKLISSFFTVGFWTLLSRILGFLRDILMAAYLGSGPVAEAFLIAFSLPNLFRRFFAEGAFNMAFIPLFSKKLERGDAPLKFAQDAFIALGLTLMTLTVVGFIFMPVLVSLIAYGFQDGPRFDLTVYYARIAFPYIFFISLSALLSGILNALGRFAVAAAAPMLLNVLLVAAMLWSIMACQGECSAAVLQTHMGKSLIYAVPFAGLIQLALVWRYANRAGFPMAITRPKLTPDLKRLLVIAAPVALTGGVVQVNLLIGRQIASFYEGAVAWLSYADRLYQLPLGVVGIAVGVVLLPDLSRKLQAKDDIGGRDAFNRATEFSLMLTVPAAAALMVIPVPLISALFERGAFTQMDTANTALAVAVYGLGLPAFVLQKTLQPLYFAREDTQRPFHYALVAMAVNALIAIGLSPSFGFIAAAVGTTATGWFMVLQLWLGTRTMGQATQIDSRLKERGLRILSSTCIMSSVLLALQRWVLPLLAQSSWSSLGLILCVSAGLLTYFGVGQLIGAFSLKEFKGSFGRNSV